MAAPEERPKPWWDGHPDIEAMVARTEREILGDPPHPDERESALPLVSKSSTNVDDFERHGAQRQHRNSWWDDEPDESDSSTNVDDSNSEGAQGQRPKPWWDGHPDIEAMVARTEREIYGRPERPEIDYRDPVLFDVLSGNSIRELREARDDLARAKTRCENAVRTARICGLSWAQIGTVLRVSRQQLHRRYRDLPGY